MEEANEYLHKCSEERIQAGVHYRRKEKLTDILSEVKEKLRPLKEVYSWDKKIELKVNSQQYVCYDNKYYSVPTKYVGARVLAIIGIYSIKIYYQNEEVASHRRSYDEVYIAELNHYTELLLRRPRGIKDCRAFKNHEFNKNMQEMLKKLLEIKDDPSRAYLEFMKIYKLRTGHSEKEFNEAVDLALAYGARSAEGVKAILEQLNTEQLRININNELSDFVVELDLSIYDEPGEIYD
jgi:hypothetical protein